MTDNTMATRYQKDNQKSQIEKGQKIQNRGRTDNTMATRYQEDNQKSQIEE